MTNKPEAFEAYQLGVHFWNTRTKEHLNKAAEYFQKAVELDPQFARARAMLADTYNLLGYNEFANPSEMYEKSRIAAEEALAQDDSIAEAHIAIAAVKTSAGGFEKALQSIERAIERAPYNSTVRIRHAWILFRLKKREQAMGEMRLAQEYDPLSTISNSALCNIQVYEQNFSEAVRACELSPESATRIRLAYAYFFISMPAKPARRLSWRKRRSKKATDNLVRSGCSRILTQNRDAAPKPPNLSNN